MKNAKIGLRLHIFLAFLIVFLISFAVILVSFNLFVQNYIHKDATAKLNQSITLARNLAKETRFFPIADFHDDDINLVVNTVVLTLKGSSDVNVSLISTDSRIQWPTTSYYIREKITTQNVLNQLSKQHVPLGESGVKVIRIDESSFYIASVPIVVSRSGSVSYLLLYLDASPYFVFLKSINQLLYVILIISLFLTLLTSLIVSNSIIQSIRKLTNFASKIGSGIFQRHDFVFFDKELNALASDMNIMAEKLELSDKEQKTFFQNASHELRTPLMSIQGYAEGIRYKVFDDQESAADVIISESQRLTGMVENLLSISRLDTAAAGRQQTSKQLIDLNELLESVADKVRGSALLVNKDISVHIHSKDNIILGNENDLFRAFENILSNGIRYAASNVALSISKATPETIVVEVMDDGKGISEDLMTHLFDRFARGEDGKHGIGLALVKAIITDHDGSVTASNRTDGKTGAIFQVTLHPAEQK